MDEGFFHMGIAIGKGVSKVEQWHLWDVDVDKWFLEVSEMGGVEGVVERGSWLGSVV